MNLKELFIIFILLFVNVLGNELAFFDFFSPKLLKSYETKIWYHTKRDFYVEEVKIGNYGKLRFSSDDHFKVIYYRHQVPYALVYSEKDQTCMQVPYGDDHNLKFCPDFSQIYIDKEETIIGPTAFFLNLKKKELKFNLIEGNKKRGISAIIAVAGLNTTDKYEIALKKSDHQTPLYYSNQKTGFMSKTKIEAEYLLFNSNPNIQMMSDEEPWTLPDSCIQYHLLHNQTKPNEIRLSKFFTLRYEKEYQTFEEMDRPGSVAKSMFEMSMDFTNGIARMRNQKTQHSKTIYFKKHFAIEKRSLKGRCRLSFFDPKEPNDFANDIYVMGLLLDIEKFTFTGASKVRGIDTDVFQRIINLDSVRTIFIEYYLKRYSQSIGSKNTATHVPVMAIVEIRIKQRSKTDNSLKDMIPFSSQVYTFFEYSPTNKPIAQRDILFATKCESNSDSKINALSIKFRIENATRANDLGLFFSRNKEKMQDDITLLLESFAVDFIPMNLEQITLERNGFTVNVNAKFQELVANDLFFVEVFDFRIPNDHLKKLKAILSYEDCLANSLNEFSSPGIKYCPGKRCYVLSEGMFHEPSYYQNNTENCFYMKKRGHFQPFRLANLPMYEEALQELALENQAQLTYESLILSLKSVTLRTPASEMTNAIAPYEAFIKTHTDIKISSSSSLAIGSPLSVGSIISCSEHCQRMINCSSFSVCKSNTEALVCTLSELSKSDSKLSVSDSYEPQIDCNVYEMNKLQLFSKMQGPRKPLYIPVDHLITLLQVENVQQCATTCLEQPNQRCASFSLVSEIIPNIQRQYQVKQTCYIYDVVCSKSMFETKRLNDRFRMGRIFDHVIYKLNHFQEYEKVPPHRLDYLLQEGSLMRSLMSDMNKEVCSKQCTGDLNCSEFAFCQAHQKSGKGMCLFSYENKNQNKMASISLEMLKSFECDIYRKKSSQVLRLYSSMGSMRSNSISKSSSFIVIGLNPLAFFIGFTLSLIGFILFNFYTQPKPILKIPENDLVLVFSK